MTKPEEKMSPEEAFANKHGPAISEVTHSDIAYPSDQVTLGMLRRPGADSLTEEKVAPLVQQIMEAERSLAYDIVGKALGDPDKELGKKISGGKKELAEIYLKSGVAIKTDGADLLISQVETAALAAARQMKIEIDRQATAERK